MSRELTRGFFKHTLRRSDHGVDGFKATRAARHLSESELTRLVFFLLDAFLFVARIPDGEIDEKERRVFDHQLRTSATYPPGLYRDLLWLLSQARHAVTGDGEDWLVALERTGERMRNLAEGSSGGLRKARSQTTPGSSPAAQDLLRQMGLLQGMAEAGSSHAILMPGGGTVYEPASFADAHRLLSKTLARDDYEFFADTLIICAVDVITDSWTLGEESMTLEDHALLSAICTTFEIDLSGMPERDRRRAQARVGG